jgi:hypothetical protein
MNYRHVLIVTALASAATTAFAQQAIDSAAPLTRAEVRQSVLAARAAGRLTPPGEGAEYSVGQPVGVSTLARSEVRREVLQARADGALIPAGQGEDEFLAHTPSTSSDTTRADVKLATLQALRDGQLVPPGSFDDGSLVREKAQARYAQAAWQARKSAGAVAAAE